MRAGELRHKIAIDRAVTTLNAAGESVADAWQPVADGVYTSIAPARPTQALPPSAEQATHLFTMRFLADVRANDRVTFGVRTFRVTATLDPDGRGIELRVYAKEVA